MLQSVKTHARADIIDRRQWFHRALAALLVMFSAFLIWGSRHDARVASSLYTKLHDIVTPVVSFVAAPADGFAHAGDSVSSFFAALRERDALQRENALLLQWKDMALALQAENDALRQLLNYIPPASHNYVSATVVADHDSPFSQTLLINRGSLDGVMKGQAVMSDQGLVGRIIASGDYSSRVLLLTDRSSRVPVISEKTGFRAILSGNDGMMLQLLHVPANAVLEPGERLLTSGDGGVFAHGLPVGTVHYADQHTPAAFPYFHEKGLQKVSVVEMGRPKLPAKAAE